TLPATPKIVEQTDPFGNVHRTGQLGIYSAGPGEVVRHGPVGALRAAVAETWRMTTTTLTGVWQMIEGVRSTDDVGGPLRIAKMAGDVAQLGVAAWLTLAALLSVNLGLINLFPIPMLDGGHLAFYAAEAVRGRPLGPRAQEWGFRVGLAL